MKRKSALLVSLLAAAAALALMIAPVSAVLVFATPEERIPMWYSYFDLTVLGYGNFFPILAGGFTALLLGALLWELFTKKPSRFRRGAGKNCAVLACVTSALSLLLFNQVSVWGIVIAALLAVSAVLLFCYYRITPEAQ